MGIILYIGKNKEIIDNINDISCRNHKLAVLNLKYNYKHYIEEYIPDYILLSEDTDDFEEISEYIADKTDSRLIITGNNKRISSILSGVPITGCPENIEQIERIVETIDSIDMGYKEESKDYRFLKQEVISFYSVQGGVGKTSLAFNTAWQLRKKNIGKILILDLNFCEGPSDIHIGLNISGYRTIGNYINNVLMGDVDIKKSTIELNEIDILCPPLSLYQSDRFDIDMLNGLIYAARNEYDVIIADIPFRYDNISLEMVNLSTTSVLVLSSDIKIAPRILEFKKFLPDNQKKIAVLNKIEDMSGIRIEDFENIMEIPVCARFPFIPNREKSLIGDNKTSVDIINMQAGINGRIDNIF